MKKFVLILISGLLAVTMFFIGYRSVPVALAANTDIPPVPDGYERLVPSPGANWGGAVLGRVSSDSSIYTEMSAIYDVVRANSSVSSSSVMGFKMQLILHDGETGSYRSITMDYSIVGNAYVGNRIRSYYYNKVNSAYAWEISYNSTSAQYNSGDFTPFYDDSYLVYFLIVPFSYRNNVITDYDFSMTASNMNEIYLSIIKLFNEYIELYVPVVEPPPPSQSEIDAAYNAGYNAGLNQSQVGANADLISQNNALQSQISDLTSQNTQLNQNYNTLNSQYTQLQNSVDSRVQQAQTAGYNSGYSAGIAAGGQNNFLSLMSAVVDAPLQAFAGIFDLEILGFNMKNFLLGVVSVAFTAMIARFALRLFA